MSDLCATVGCNHRRDEHGSGHCNAAVRLTLALVDCECVRFTEPPTVSEPLQLSANMSRVIHAMGRHGGVPVERAVAEHDDNLDLEAIRARADEVTKLPMGNLIDHLLDGRAGGYTQGGRQGAASAVIARRRSADDVPALLVALDAERAKNTEARLHVMEFHQHSDPLCSDCHTIRILGR